VIRVVVGLLEDAAGNVLLGQRRAGTHMAGQWEFPGGKQQATETAFAALCREIREELAVEVSAAESFLVIEHRYPDRHVRLDTWLVTAWTGEPRGCEGQQLRWVAPHALHQAGLLEADLPIVDALLSRARE
jgi:8-oxo-dGTP diphosphatase